MAHAGFDELDGAPRSHDVDIDGQLARVDDSEDVVCHSGNELIARQATFQFREEKPGGRRQVLLAGLPGALRVQGRDESVLPETNIIGIRVFFTRGP